jgi:hypothetical protein
MVTRTISRLSHFKLRTFIDEKNIKNDCKIYMTCYMSTFEREQPEINCIRVVYMARDI